ncbi:hypothetical protein ZWY2020_056072 [Hordeum vulgare]|nr:hypothetical protein ZWY2020_056072 [Hordeum vulgare]
MQTVQDGYGIRVLNHTKDKSPMLLPEETIAPVTHVDPALPLEPEEESSRNDMMVQQTIAYEKLRSFCANIMKKLAPPLVHEVQASNLRPGAEPFTPNRMTRATKRNASASTTKTKPMENVQLHALGLTPEYFVADEAVAQELQQLFESPLRV